MGFFTLELAERVLPMGRVIPVDIQNKLLDNSNAAPQNAVC